jgi:outer membrane protein OmpA-like peptidoglycan-associated protein
MVYWDLAARAETEQVKVLLPLSRQRAEVIKEALVKRGVVAARMSTFGYGGSYPVVPHGDQANRWKNRRVEFILE